MPVVFNVRIIHYHIVFVVYVTFTPGLKNLPPQIFFIIDYWYLLQDCLRGVCDLSDLCVNRFLPRDAHSASAVLLS